MLQNTLRITPYDEMSYRLNEGVLDSQGRGRVQSTTSYSGTAYHDQVSRRHPGCFRQRIFAYGDEVSIGELVFCVKPLKFASRLTTFD